MFPSSSLTVSRAPLQFPGCITCSLPIPSPNHVLPSSSLNVPCVPLQLPHRITCSPPIPWLYNVLHSSSLAVSRASLQFPGGITYSFSIPWLKSSCKIVKRIKSLHTIHHDFSKTPVERRNRDSLKKTDTTFLTSLFVI